MEDNKELNEYKVQRKFIGWEETTVEAKSFDEAVQIAEDKDSWYDAMDSYLATEDYWVKNEDTNEIKTRMENENWEDSI